jgi:hypothetical protein
MVQENNRQSEVVRQELDKKTLKAAQMPNLDEFMAMVQSENSLGNPVFNHYSVYTKYNKTS